MSQPSVCPKCAAAIPADAPAGLCPKCLLQAVQADDSECPAESAAMPSTIALPPADDLPGAMIGRYKLLQQIGEGGMGVVYLAEQVEPVRRKVALKIIKPGLDTRHVIARFEAERQALALMDHQHIARVLDAGTVGDATAGRPYFVMELVKGVPITEYCDTNQLSIRERLELLVPVCQAIQHAHQKGIIHRDIKPSNVLVCLYDGRSVPKVIDFGVAKAIEQPLVQQTLFTQYGQVVGTLEYMSPEQAELNQLDVDTRSDIYSLGVLLYELLTGTTPLTKTQLRQAAFAEVLRLIRESEPERPSARLSHSGEALATVSAQRRSEPEKLPRLLRGELDWIVLKALEKDRTRRYATAADLARDLERHLGDEPVEACPPSVGYRLRKTARKYRLALITGVAFLALLIAGITASAWQAIRATQAENQALTDRGKALTAEQLAGQEKDEAVQAKHREELAHKAEARRAVELRDALRHSEGLRLTAQSSVVLPENPGLALLLALEGAQRGGRSAMHNNALLAALSQCREIKTLRSVALAGHGSVGPWSVTSATFSRHGGTILTTLEAVERLRFQRRNVNYNLNLNLGEVQIWTGDGHLLTTIMAPPHQHFAEVKLSPDGRLLAGRFTDSSLLVYDTDKDWRKRERWLYTDRVVRIWDTSTGKELHVLRGHRDRVVALSFSPDNRHLMTASWDKSCRIWDAHTGQQLREIDGSSAFETAVFSPDGRRILTVSIGLDRNARYEDDPRERLRPQKVDAPLTTPQPEAHPLQVSAAGQQRGYAGMSIGSITVTVPLLGPMKFKPRQRSGIRLWDAETTKEIAGSQPNSEPVENDTACAMFTEDGQHVIAASRHGTILYISATTGKRLRTFNGRELLAIRSITSSRDGRRLLVVHEDNRLAVHDVLSGKELRSWPGPSLGVRAATLDSDGRHVMLVRGRSAQSSSLYTPETRTVSILDVETGKEAGILKGHEDDVTSVSLSPDGRQILTSSLDGTARLWAAEVPGYGLVFPSSGPAASALFSPDGRYVFVAHAQAYSKDSWDSFGGMWETASGKRIASLRGQSRPGASAYATNGFGGVSSAQFSPDGKRLLTVSRDRRVGVIKPDAPGSLLFKTPFDKWPLAENIPATPVRVWDVATGHELLALHGLQATIRWASFSPNGRQILTLSERMEDYVYFQLKNGQKAISGSQSRWTAAPHQALVHVWDAHSGNLAWKVRDLLNPESDWMGPFAWRNDNHTFAAGHLFGLLDLKAGKRLVLIGFRSASVPRFSLDGRYLLGTVGSEATLFDLATLQPTNGWTGGALELRTTGADGREAIKTIERGDTFGCTSVKLLGHDGPITAAAFSPDNRWVVTASADRTARIWEVSSGKLHCALRGHLRRLNAVAFSPDGKQVVTASDDHTARLWDTATGNEVLTFTNHHGPVRTAVFSPDGSQVLTASDDGTARLWPADPLPSAQERRPRELTPEERTRFAVRSAF